MNKNEAWSKLIGNEHLKRAMEVALAGGHTIAVFGHPDNGKKYLKEILGKKLLFLSPCPCGNLGDSLRVCTCTFGRVKKYRITKRFQKAALSDIRATLITPRFQDFERAGKAEPFLGVEKRIAAMNGLQVEDGKGAYESLLRTAIERLHFTAGMVERVRAVARTIARLEHAPVVKVHHLSEAIQYGGIDPLERR
ncbi:MAG TPA: hypothetical protein DDW94_11640 [Deltaproteobacteria bacterium]|nr:MAG: hypothetical protein A2Z79_05195 [Deltaproteobacteria bacterium GWA2_55_82]OGQ63830.1 MAG: hypothetical protein A3I81_12455 [Deltaproteobacteria bacterium RIFCSPLOWO2_02_FULL_55_12]OIJ72711.1 MAG: hypothetical protein A2V21_312770 [Deltaproteobacteria bacterium GWC2_55_46]HBG47622.1 hypothetical protein [Deltaproteobacteria bacterium]HCY10533.1 hypothetical protein [Deltaproteobacteria bacterium]